ncbi:MAG: AmiS/UreI family transporter [Actinobacteria bacterium]|nr:AmiS/UreI family transporter [Actinomycetota bacterium]
MTAAILIFIALMWFPIALLLLGHGEAKGTGLATGVVGLFVVIGATLQAAVFKDAWTAGLLYVHGIFYLTVSWSFMTGQTDLRPMGNVSLTTALVSTVYAIVFLIGGPDVDGAPLVAANWSLFIMATIYAILTYEVFLNCYGKLSGKILAWSLIVGVVASLWIPAFWILVAGKLPF